MISVVWIFVALIVLWYDELHLNVLLLSLLIHLFAMLNSLLTHYGFTSAALLLTKGIGGASSGPLSFGFIVTTALLSKCLAMKTTLTLFGRFLGASLASTGSVCGASRGSLRWRLSRSSLIFSQCVRRSLCRSRIVRGARSWDVDHDGLLSHHTRIVGIFVLHSAVRAVTRHLMSVGVCVRH